VPSRSDLGECDVGIKVWTAMMIELPGSERLACQAGMVSENLEPPAGRFGAPAQRSIAYKPPRGEIAVCPRMGADGVD
jgi:hypothetical protein